MRISFIAFALFVYSWNIYAQGEVRQLGSFQGVKSSEAIDVYLKKGDKESVRIEATGVSPSDVITEVSGTTLKIHMRSGNWHNRRSVKAYVTYVKLEKLSANSAANIFAQDPIKATNMEINVSSAGHVEIKIDAESINVNASSAGATVLEGSAKSLDIDASSAGDIDAYNLTSESVTASVSSAGVAKINVSKDLEAHASSGGDIRYRGNPTRTNTESSSGGSVKKTSNTN